MLLLYLVVHSLVYCTSDLLSDYNDVAKFIDKIQNPSACNSMPYTQVYFGRGGGFASQFQMVVSMWLKVQTWSGYSLPVVIKGQIKGYSNSPHCKAHS